MSTHLQSSIVVHGYIHQIQSLLTNTNIVPLEIITLCLNFYVIPICRFVNHEIETEQFLSLNINNKHICSDNVITINPDPKLCHYNSALKKPFCFIPEFSLYSSLPINTIPIKHYDAILTRTRGPCLILFQSLPSIRNTNISYYIYESNTTFGWNTPINSYSFCGPKNGIIAAAHFDELYQLKLQDIHSKDYQFKKIAVSNNIFHEKDFCLNQLTTKYLSTTEKLFAIHTFAPRHQYTPVITHNIFTTKVQNDETVECGIYNLNTTQWIKLDVFKNDHSVQNEGYFKCAVCNSPKDDNIIYIITQSGILAKFDFIKNKWNTLYSEYIEGINKFSDHKSWFDDFDEYIIYWTHTDHNGMGFKYLDIRDNKAKWNNIEINVPYKKLQYATVII